MDAKLEWLKRNEQWKCDDRWERRAADKTGWNTNGINTLVAPHHPYAEQVKLREDISDLGAASAESKRKRLTRKKFGKHGTRIVVDLLYDEIDGAERKGVALKRKDTSDSDMDSSSSHSAKRSRPDGAE
eukprot:COSAG02_NODE_9449_length_2212_cov_13.234098_1_plen_129_part_10